MVDLEKLKLLYNFGRNLSLADIQVLLKSARTQSFDQGEYLITEGQLKKEIFLIRKGLVRGFRINDKGEEITTLLRWEHQVVASPQLILFDQASKQYFEAHEPTKVFCINYERLQTIISDNPKLEANRKFVFQNILRQALARIDSFVLMSPEERYVDFIESRSDVANRVPDKYIAHLLGITPVSLSRIRKRIASKKN